MNVIRSLGTLSLFSLLSFFAAGAPLTAHALDLDWSGQFRTESNSIFNYTLGGDKDATNPGSGYTIPGGGSKDASFQNVFLRVRPKVIVNDNISIKSEWWAGDPVYGLFGSATPYSLDQKQYYSNQSRGAALSAQRMYAEFLSDIGTVVVGRAPLNWGLGLVWNSSVDHLWDRYPTTGDTIRLVSKFGAFTVIPSVITYSAGNSIGGGCTGVACANKGDSAAVNEYSLAFRYENPEEDFEAGANYIRRLGRGNQDTIAQGGYQSQLDAESGGFNLTTWDLYGRKRFGKFSVAGEVPIMSGLVDGVSANAVAAAVELDWQATDALDVSLRGGYAPGQASSNGDPTQFTAFYFHPDYRPALILFNYQLANFAGPVTSNDPTSSPTGLKSPYDNPVANAKYLSGGIRIALEKWDIRSKVIVALADQVAQNGKKFLNTWDRKLVDAVGTQESFMGTELDLGVSFKWDESFSFHADGGVLLPGAYYAFSNVAGITNPTEAAFAASLKVGVNF
jgi:hypothetical protein